ncbi:hypothetical protein B0A49_08709, partial [Cryomyces minteri]
MLQTEKTLPQPVHSNLLAYCPTMDLIAIVTEDEQLDVYRLNGQRAFGMKRKSPRLSIDSMCWKFNGQYLAVAWDDGSVDTLSAESGKVDRQGLRETSTGDGTSRTSCLGWGVNFIDIVGVRARTETSSDHLSASFEEQLQSRAAAIPWTQEQEKVTLDDFLERNPDLDTLGVHPELPKQLALLDVESLLPKLSSLIVRSGQAALPGFRGKQKLGYSDPDVELFNSQSILVYAGDEGRQFSAFSKWLRFQIDMQVTEPGSIAAEETAEQEAGIDYIQVLAYVEGALNHSKLDPFLTQDLAGEPS